MRHSIHFVALAMLLWAQCVHADIDVRVGAGAGCNYNTIQAAITGALPANGITNILIARNQAYNAQQLDIDGRNVRLIGGYANCQQAVRDSTKTVLNGSGGAARSILNIRGATSVIGIYLLDFQNGDELTDTSSYGGAIDITQGPHSLIYLEENRFFNNRAGLGGAISIRNATAAQSGVYVRFASRNIVLQNAGIRAAGGIYCRGATLDIKGESTYILQNSSGDDTSIPVIVGNGGGLFADDCRVDIGGKNAIFDGNVANGAGGGIYAYGSQTLVNLYNIDADNPHILSNNTAGSFGGGIDVEQGAKVNAWDMIIRNNVARGGGGAVALYDDGASDSSTFTATRYFDAGTPNGDPATFSRAYNCAQPEACNRIENNSAETPAGAGLDGGAVRISADDDGRSAVILVGTRLTLNHGDSIVRLKSFADYRSVARIVINGGSIDNNSALGFFVNSFYGRTQMLSSSVASNVFGAASFSNEPMTCPGFEISRMEGNAFWQLGKTMVSLANGGPSAGCGRFNVANSLVGLAPADQQLSLQADPKFVDAANGNLRLLPVSPAIDFVPVLPGTATRDGLPRVEDVAGAGNAFGPQDAGAYELTNDADLIFRSNFDGN